MAWERDDYFQGIPFLAMSAFMLAVWKYGGGVVCTKSDRIMEGVWFVLHMLT